MGAQQQPGSHPVRERLNLPEEVEVELGLDEPQTEEHLRQVISRKLSIPAVELPSPRVVRRSVDARGRVVHFVVGVRFDEPETLDHLGEPHPREVHTQGRVIIIGDGPAGMFCAYELARRGIGSVVLDRGKQVQPRRKDLKGLNRDGVVDPDSNYCFGEGGAGTYSDGKLYTRATKRGDVRDVMEILALHHAPADILVEARPHIGSNRLPQVVTAIRQRLESVGVEFRFNARVVGLLTEGDPPHRRVAGVQLQSGEQVTAECVVVATGHSARDVYQFLAEGGVPLEAKPFALGLRIEHPQPLINRMQYGAAAGHPSLSSASYRLAHTRDGRGVFSFCMCPGGFIVPASTEAGALVVNGMSLKRRDSPFANSGMVVSIEVEDALSLGFSGPFACLEIQRRVEEAAWIAGGGALKAPAIRVTDFVAGRTSSTLPPTSYQPGLVAADVAGVLDSSGLPLVRRLQEALRVFGGQMRGYVSPDAVLVGVESRTSAPVRIPRDPQTLMSPGVIGLFPSGEGAGYAGGIVSAAMDGIRVARGVATQLGVPSS